MYHRCMSSTAGLQVGEGYVEIVMSILVFILQLACSEYIMSASAESRLVFFGAGIVLG